MNNPKIWISAFLLAGVFGCSKDNFPKYNVLQDLRVITLVANAPEVALNTSGTSVVQIQPYVSDVNGSGGLSYVAKGCWNFAVENGGDPTCEGNATVQTIASGNLSAPSAASAYTGAADAFNVTIPAANAAVLVRSSAAQFNGIPYLVTYELKASDGRSVKAFKRILVSTNSVKNSNPQVGDILKVSGGAYTAFELGHSVDLTFSLGTASTEGAESYSWQTDQGQLRVYTEDLTATWFVTDGTMKYFRTTWGSPINTYQNPDAAPAGNRKAYLILVLRDNRGGVSVKVNALN
jgi:hypothetical protein